MNDLWRNLKNWQKMGILGGFLAIIVIIVVVVINVTSRSGINVEINFGEGVNIPSSEITKIREKLVGVIKDNTKDFDERTTYVGDARDYQENLSDETSSAIFVVDFDSIKESYIVEVSWPNPNDGSPNMLIACPLMASKYPETPCVTEINSSLDITSYLPYDVIDDEGKVYKIEGNYSGGKLYLEIATDGDPEKALTAVKDWIKSIGLKPDDYLYYIPTNQYIQFNHANTNDANVNANLPYFIPDKYYVYPVVDENNKVTSIKAVLGACTEAQTSPAETLVKDYLGSKGINYPVEFEYCAN